MFAIVTPAKNEERNLPRVMASVLNQKMKPCLWVIVDDGSTDKTCLLIKKAMNENQLIQSIFLKSENKEYDQIIRYGYIVREGFDYCMYLESRLGFVLDFFAILDADIILDDNYYDQIINAFNRNESLGILSGLWIDKHSDVKGNPHYSFVKSVCGGAMVFRRRCLTEIQGFPVAPKPDTVSKIRAADRGWQIRVIQSTRCFHLRPKTKNLSMYLKLGIAEYVLNYHPIIALLSCLNGIVADRNWLWLGYLAGYARGMISLSKIRDKEVRDFFGRNHIDFGIVLDSLRGIPQDR